MTDEKEQPWVDLGERPPVGNVIRCKVLRWPRAGAGDELERAWSGEGQNLEEKGHSLR